MLKASAHRHDRMGRDESDSGEGLPQSDARRRVQGFSLQQASLAMTGTRLGAACPKPTERQPQSNLIVYWPDVTGKPARTLCGLLTPVPLGNLCLDSSPEVIAGE